MKPTRSLDPLAAAEFRRFLVQRIVREQGATVLFASHTLAEVEQMANQVAVLDRGRLLLCDTRQFAGRYWSRYPRAVARDTHTSRRARNFMTGTPDFRATLRN